ncbi:flagellar type III secretion system protein FlhB [Maritimibacter sp. UBA3975]|uniref:EscU/YscU/HrcU family type III secretion system export apparatus switch protein n=1 Tax=Maritimibacter sp. UBA3975 TaxID=1946833 RepID=UPI000C0927B0|nr:flagellar type III secretion system protein FlhB [Maritimibacter sp. UBA3975]MAM61854.1 flagellar biosynthesis protein FlhB [Maritimibacter sp.]|tara:strand:+ start:5081 stop:6166 length:1086 start_codon:yes stop_codon:yes gene_type:complete
MSDETAAADKEHEPTQKKLDDARKKGEFARSADLNTAIAYFGLLVAGSAIGATSLAGLGEALAGLLRHAGPLASDAFSGGGRSFTGTLLGDVAASIGPLFAIPAIAVLLAIIAQRAFVVAPEKLAPKLSRISPVSNAKNKFGRAGLFEFAKSFAKLTIYSFVLGIFLWRRLPEMLGTIGLTPGLATAVLLDLCLDFLLIVLVIAGVIGGIDLIWQQQEHLRKNRMSRKEVMDESKQNEGDPHLKQARRQRGYDIAMNRMLSDVPEADVVVVNPTHYAVALKWSRLPGAAPVCVAKGVDEVAARIRETAQEAGVPIHRDPPTARAIHATVEIGEEIRPDQYQAAAVAIRFAEEIRRKARARG